MKVGIIAPIKFLNKYCRTHIQYCLPSLLVDSKEYRQFYIKRSSVGNTIILDCKKINWKREPENFNIIEEVLHYVNPNIVISPSYMFNLKETQKIQKEFRHSFPQLRDKTIECIEGASSNEIKVPKKTVAAPSHIYRYLSDLKLNSHTIYLDNHLTLGELDGREGILVTSLPIRLGLQGRILSDYRPAPPSLIFYEEEDMYEQITEQNVEETLEYYEEN